MAKQENLVVTGLVTEALGNSLLRVLLDGPETLVVAQLSGKMRKFSIKIIPGDKVRLEMSPYDLTRGRIVTRLKTESQKEEIEEEENDSKKSKKKK